MGNEHVSTESGAAQVAADRPSRYNRREFARRAGALGVGLPLVAAMGRADSVVAQSTPAVDVSRSPSAGDAASPDVMSILAGRAAHTATDLGDGTTLVVGGCVSDGCTAATASTIVVSAAGAVLSTDLHDPRDAHTATRMVDRSVLVTGGFAAEGEAPLASAELYNPGSRRWSVVSSMNVGRGGHVAARLGDGRVLVIGGWVAPRQYTATSEIYDPGLQGSSQDQLCLQRPTASPRPPSGTAQCW